MTSRTFAALALAVAITLPRDGGAQTQLTGGGATFPYPVYSKWFAEYHKLHPQVQINYQSLGSGAGIRQVTDGTVDFGGSDMPLTPEQQAEFRTKRGTELLHFPTVLGAVVPAYNLPSVTAPLKFTGEALAGIFLGTITKWNDPAIARANAGVALPSSDIIVVHRSDGSGTTFVWTDYLSKISPVWLQKVGRNTSVNWPVGLGGRGNEGVAGTVKQTVGSIGYIELVYALQNNIKYGSVQNSTGAFVAANFASVTAAAAGAAANMPADFRVSITNAPGAAAYPVSSFTWLLIPARIQDAAKRQVLVDFLRWMLKDGQALAEGLSYARLPAEVIARETQAIANIK
jgi:phosphate transport system substrate-binding protein